MQTIEEIKAEHKGKKICILGNGSSTFDHDNMMFFNYSDYEYVWTVNYGWMTHTYSNLGFLMDDWLSPAHDTDNLTRDNKESRLLKTTIPILTNTVYPGFECMVRYPLKEVCNVTHRLYFGETVSYMVAFAIYCEVAEIHFHGCDYHFCKAAERACTEGWITMAQERGIVTAINTTSHLMQTQLDARNNFVPNFYGYLPETFPFDVAEDKQDGTVRISAEEKPERLAEIEEYAKDYKTILEKRHGESEDEQDKEGGGKSAA